MASFNAIVTLSLLALLLVSSNAQLTADFYSNSCPLLFSTVQSTLQSAIANDPRNGASIVRLFYLDCFVNGCDASILLDDTLSFTGEKNAASNKNLTRGFDVIDNIKTALENVCPGVVSCADVLAVAAHDSIVALGGPSWAVKLGRRDALTASQATANQSIPAPTSSLDELVSSFARVGLSAQDMVALSGAHTLGQAQCSSFRAHIYSDSDIDATFAQAMRANCPQTAGSGDSNLAPLDLLNTTSFDNGYYKNLVGHKGLLHSDQELFNGGSTDSLVKSYANDQDIFYSDFVSAMIKMGDIKPLMGSDGEIRKNCRVTN